MINHFDSSGIIDDSVYFSNIAKDYYSHCFQQAKDVKLC